MSWIKLGEKLDLKLEARRRQSIREQFHEHTSVPVVESDCVDTPTVVGEYGGWFTKAGNRIHYPSAYSKKGFSNMMYLCSTRKILVPPNIL